LKNRAKIKVFVDGHVFDIPSQGSATYLKNILQIISQSSAHTLYVGCKELPSVLQGVESIVHVPYRCNSSASRIFFEIPKIVAGLKPEYCWFQYIIPPLLFRAKTVVTIHDVLPLDFPDYFSIPFVLKCKLLFRLSAKLSDRVFTVSDYSKERLHKHFLLPNEKIVVTPNGVSDRFLNTNRVGDRGEAFLLYVSRVEPRKRQLELANAFVSSRFASKGYKLVLIGADYSDGLLDKFIGNDLVDYRGEVSDTDLLKLFSTASGFVYPSAAEGFGIPPLEAAAVGCPVLCSNETAMKDFDFFSPHHKNLSSQQEFLHALNDFYDFVLMGDQNACASISNHVREKYNWEVSAEKILDFFV